MLLVLLPLFHLLQLLYKIGSLIKHLYLAQAFTNTLNYLPRLSEIFHITQRIATSTILKTGVSIISCTAEYSKTTYVLLYKLLNNLTSGSKLVGAYTLARLQFCSSTALKVSPILYMAQI